MQRHQAKQISHTRGHTPDHALNLAKLKFQIGRGTNCFLYLSSKFYDFPVSNFPLNL